MNEHVESLDCLNAEQKSELLQALKSYPTLFRGGVGKLHIKPISLELKRRSKCVWNDNSKRDRTIQKKTWNLEASWPLPIAGTSIQPKKTGDVRVLTDFRKLNEYLQLVRKQHPLPKINELFYKCAWYFPKYHDATPWWLEYVQVYMDDILITSKGTYYSDHS